MGLFFGFFCVDFFGLGGFFLRNLKHFETADCVYSMQNAVTSFAPKTNNSYMGRNKQPTIKEWGKEILFIGIHSLYFGQHGLSIVLMPNASKWLMLEL